MGHESMTKIKEKFALKHAIIKEFLAEFLGIFVLIVSRLRAHLLSCCLSQPAGGLEGAGGGWRGCHSLWDGVGPPYKNKKNAHHF